LNFFLLSFALLFQPGVALKHAKEGTESSAFWFALGGKQSYTSKKFSPETVRDPHLFTFSFNKGDISNSESWLIPCKFHLIFFEINQIEAGI
jgi:hypothetical protein